MRHLLLALTLMVALAPAAYAQLAPPRSPLCDNGGTLVGLPAGGAVCATNGNILEPQAPIPCMEMACRFFAVTTAHGFLYGLVNAIISLVGFALLAAYLYAGGLWITSLGDSGKISEAKKIIVEATTGLVVVLLSYFIVQTVITMRG